MDIGVEDSEEVVRVSANEQLDRILLCRFFDVGLPKRIYETASVDRRPQTDAAAWLSEVQTAHRSGCLGPRLLPVIVGREKVSEDRDRDEQDRDRPSDHPRDLFVIDYYHAP